MSLFELVLVDGVLNVDNIDKLQMEATYWIGGKSDSSHGDMSRSSRLEVFHSDVFKDFGRRWLGENYAVGELDELGVEGFLTFEFEIRIHSASRRKFQFSGHKLNFWNNYHPEVYIFQGNSIWGTFGKITRLFVWGKLELEHFFCIFSFKSYNFIFY